jgi:hypothetical protein
MPDAAGAIDDTVFTEETCQDDLLEALGKLDIAFQKIFHELDFSTRACSLHQDLLVNGTCRDAKAALIAPIDQFPCLL